MGKPPVRISEFELLILSTAIGLVAVLATPWVELQGTFQSWRLVEWHTFWQGERPFLLSDLVASNYQIAIEFATREMPDTLRALLVLGGFLGAWHLAVLLGMLVLGGRRRAASGTPGARVLAETLAVCLILIVVLFALGQILILPSNRSLKVDFRTPSDVHTESLVWSALLILPVAPVVALLAAFIQVVLIARLIRARQALAPKISAFFLLLTAF